MKVRTSILLACSISAGVLLTGCSINRADSLRMLDRRAEYDVMGPNEPLPALKEGGLDGFRQAPVPVRSRGLVATVCVYPREIARNVYFWGGWVSLVIEEPQWVLSQPGGMPQAPGIRNTPLPHAGKKRRFEKREGAQAAPPMPQSKP